MLLTGALAAFAFVKRTSLLLRIVTLPLVLTFGASQYLRCCRPTPMLRRRIVLAMFTIFQASVFLLLPYGREHFARLLAAVAVIVLAACYFGVAFLPQLSIHQLTDIAEPGLAGDWRGFFTHKNGAGASMVLLIFIGIFICRAWNRIAGTLIVILAAIFLYFTQAKSSIESATMSCWYPMSFRASAACSLALALILGVPILINLLTVGSVMFEPIRELISRFMSDPTYTGRDEIWRFALDNIAKRPLFGFGFEAFWGMPDLVNAWSYQESWGYRASDAHNGYLNLAVTTGLVGLAFSLCWIIVQPFADHRRAQTLDADRALRTLFLQIWMIGLCLSGFESELFRGGSEMWFLMVVSIIGIRF